MPLIKCPDGLYEDLSLEQRKIDYRHEAKKKIDNAVWRESLSGGMKSILAVRQRIINYRHDGAQL
jgi:hypothetical protein